MPWGERRRTGRFNSCVRGYHAISIYGKQKSEKSSSVEESRRPQQLRRHNSKVVWACRPRVYRNTDLNFILNKNNFCGLNFSGWTDAAKISQIKLVAKITCYTAYNIYTVSIKRVRTPTQFTLTSVQTRIFFEALSSQLLAFYSCFLGGTGSWGFVYLV